MRLKIVGVIIALLLLEIPFLYLSVYFHELSHKIDYKDIEKTNEDLCVLDNCDGIGHYSFEYQGQEDEINKIKQYTEIKAYIISIMVMLCYTLLSIYIMLVMVR